MRRLCRQGRLRIQYRLSLELIKRVKTAAEPKMNLNRKADANMWWIIIGAVIALVVLIVLMVIFTGKTTDLGGGLSECEGKSGVCVDPNLGCPQKTVSSSAFECKNNQKCCIGLPKKCSTNQECGEKTPAYTSTTSSVAATYYTCSWYGSERYCSNE